LFRVFFGGPRAERTAFAISVENKTFVCLYIVFVGTSFGISQIRFGVYFFLESFFYFSCFSTSVCLPIET